MGEVDQSHHAENQRDAERAQGIEAAKAQRVEDDLQQPVMRQSSYPK